MNVPKVWCLEHNKCLTKISSQRQGENIVFTIAGKEYFVNFPDNPNAAQHQILFFFEGVIPCGGIRDGGKVLSLESFEVCISTGQLYHPKKGERENRSMQQKDIQTICTIDRIIMSIPRRKDGGAHDLIRIQLPSGRPDHVTLLATYDMVEVRSGELTKVEKKYRSAP